MTLSAPLYNSRAPFQISPLPVLCCFLRNNVATPKSLLCHPRPCSIPKHKTTLLPLTCLPPNPAIKVTVVIKVEEAVDVDNKITGITMVIHLGTVIMVEDKAGADLVQLVNTIIGLNGPFYLAPIPLHGLCLPPLSARASAGILGPHPNEPYGRGHALLVPQATDISTAFNGLSL